VKLNCPRNQRRNKKGFDGNNAGSAERK